MGCRGARHGACRGLPSLAVGVAVTYAVGLAVGCCGARHGACRDLPWVLPCLALGLAVELEMARPVALPSVAIVSATALAVGITYGVMADRKTWGFQAVGFHGKPRQTVRLAVACHGMPRVSMVLRRHAVKKSNIVHL